MKIAPGVQFRTRTAGPSERRVNPVEISGKSGSRTEHGTKAISCTSASPRTDRSHVPSRMGTLACGGRPGTVPRRPRRPCGPCALSTLGARGPFHVGSESEWVDRTLALAPAERGFPFAWPPMTEDFALFSVVLEQLLLLASHPGSAVGNTPSFDNRDHVNTAELANTVGNKPRQGKTHVVDANYSCNGNLWGR